MLLHWNWCFRVNRSELKRNITQLQYGRSFNNQHKQSNQFLGYKTDKKCSTNFADALQQPKQSIPRNFQGNRNETAKPKQTDSKNETKLNYNNGP